MKRIIMFVVLIVVIMSTTQVKSQEADSTCYFVSWIAYKRLGVTVQNTIIKVPSIWTHSKVYKVAQEQDSNMIYMTYLTEVPEGTYTEFFFPDSLITNVPVSKNTMKELWYIEYATLDVDGYLKGQGEVTLIDAGLLHLKDLEKYIKESISTDSKIQVVIMRFEKKEGHSILNYTGLGLQDRFFLFFCNYLENRYIFDERNYLISEAD